MIMTNLNQSIRLFIIFIWPLNEWHWIFRLFGRSFKISNAFYLRNSLIETKNLHLSRIYNELHQFRHIYRLVNIWVSNYFNKLAKRTKYTRWNNFVICQQSLLNMATEHQIVHACCYEIFVQFKRSFYTDLSNIECGQCECHVVFGS